MATATRPATAITTAAIHSVSAMTSMALRAPCDSTARPWAMNSAGPRTLPGAGDHRGNVARAVLGPDPDAGAEHADATVVLVCERRGQHEEPAGRGLLAEIQGAPGDADHAELDRGAGARAHVAHAGERRRDLRRGERLRGDEGTDRDVQSVGQALTDGDLVHRARVGPATGDQAVAVDPAAELGSVAAPIPWKSGAEGMTSPYAGRTATAATPGSRRRRATC